MPPQLALLAGIGIMLFCLKEYEKSYVNIGKTFWVLTIWFGIIGSRSLYDWFYGTSRDGVISGTESNPINLISGIGFAAFAVYILIKKEFDFGFFVKQNLPFVILLLYCLLSCIWSESFSISFKRWVRMVLSIIVVMAIVYDPDRIKTIRTLFQRYASFAIPISIVFIKYYNHLGTRWDSNGTGIMWTGVCGHKNSLGMVLAATLLFYAWKWLILMDFKKIKLDLFLVLVASFIMFNPEVKGSSTAILSFLASLLFLFCIKFFRKSIDTFAIVFYSIILLYFGIDLVLNSVTDKSILEYVTLASGRDMTFTGRTFVWDAVIDEAANKPLFGVGYGMFWSGNRLYRLHSRYLVSDIYQAHNGYLETYANIGIFGLILLIITLFFTLNFYIKSISSNYKFHSLAIAVMIQCILAEFFEATVLSPTSSRWIILLIFLIRVPNENSSLFASVQS